MCVYLLLSFLFTGTPRTEEKEIPFPVRFRRARPVESSIGRIMGAGRPERDAGSVGSVVHAEAPEGF